ncbi:RDD family protein [Candidatus Nitrosacidococcus sp. I8]|uniref:RDD family protein n=1 Tax=Candidatus Nitrosacidococcus sp. I8 TaxID=2942908 RepID=UPI002226B46F|nr:RDD family protein [Candidatus Nitrosacidococcus sp. I8]CAH9019652.1 hypothetical protein NURINAE_01669 [Candidatus Nitrosacidococcus sp. I8]
MFCIKCGIEINENANFCQKCGSEVVNKTLIISQDIHTNKINDLRSDIETAIDKTSYHPWRRYFARTAVESLTICIIGIPILFCIAYFLGFIIGHFFPQNLNNFIKTIDNQNELVILILLYILWIPIEAAFLTTLGTTPAKWIFGIRVTSSSGKNLSYPAALKRSFLVWMQGCGFGIPLIAIITCFFAYKRLKKSGTTLWDTSVHSMVIHKQWNITRTIVSILAVVITLTLIALSSLGNT